MERESPPTSSSGDVFADPAVVDRYVADRERGLTDRERRAVERYFRPEGSQVLDVGCGAGRTSRALSQRGYDVVGVDVSEAMVRAARRQDGREPTYLVGDATALPFEDAAVAHALFSYNGLDGIAPERRRLAAITEVRRVLEPGGTFVFSSHNRRRLGLVHPPTVEELRTALGFWRRNAREGRVGSPYKRLSVRGSDRLVYFVTPRRQRRQLRACGFEPVAVLGRGGVGARLFGPTLYYVARKPRNQPAANDSQAVYNNGTRWP